MSITTINPANGQPLETYPLMDADEITAVIESANDAFHRWRIKDYHHRSTVMRKAATILKSRSTELAVLMAREMGKPLSQGIAEVEKCAWVCEHYAEHAEVYLRAEPVETEASKSYVTFQPLGLILAVMPWNFPLWQVFRFAAPALMAGNGCLLKHASNVTGSALEIESILREAGCPEHLFRTLRIRSSDVAGILESPLIKAVTLTGSGPAGQAVGQAAGKVLKKAILELGGSDAYVVLEDADLEHAAETCVSSRLINSGQSCIAAKRFIVVESVRPRFEELFVEKMRSRVMGNPLGEDTDIGPQARRDLRDELHGQVERSISQGARLLLGGAIPDLPGAFYPATVLTDVRPGMTAFDEELFGPVAAIISADSEEQAIELANRSDFGLGSAVFTRDEARGERIASGQLEAGVCVVNTYVRSDPRLPFGGIKDSGYGRELSHYGIKEFVNIKTVLVH
jgi:succinate-semialdehyde dehydrogenase/glutarate-semialdehyde dehydrogenase